MTNEEMAIFRKELELSPVLYGRYEDGYSIRLIFFSKEQGCVWYYQQDQKDPEYRAFLPNTWVLRKCSGRARNPDSILRCYRRGGIEDTCCFNIDDPLCRKHGIS